MQFGELVAGRTRVEADEQGDGGQGGQRGDPQGPESGELFAADEQQHQSAGQRQEDEQAEQGKSPADL